MITRRSLLVSTVGGMFTPWRLLGRDRKPDLVVMHTNDLHGRVAVDEAGEGLAYLGRTIDRVRSEHPVNLLLDAGDIIHGTPMEWLKGPGPVIDAMNRLRFDAAAMGNHEFDFGPENLRKAERTAHFPFLTANVLTLEGDPWGPLVPYRVFERGGRKIGVFGLTTELTPDIQWPRTIADIRFVDSIPEARKAVKALRETEQVDLVLALSHLGYQPDRKLAHEVEGIDLIVGGHSHTRLEKAVFENGVPIVQTGAYGRALGVVKVWFEPGGIETEYELVPAAGPAHEGVAKGYEEPWSVLSGSLNEELTELTTTLDAAGMTEGRTPTGTFLATCVRDVHKVEVGFFSASHFSGTLGPGRVTRNDLYERMTAYTRQHIVRVVAPRGLVTEAVAEGIKDGKATIQYSDLPGAMSERVSVAGPAHVIQSFFLDKPGVEIVFDDPLGANVRDAVMDGLASGLADRFFAEVRCLSAAT